MFKSPKSRIALQEKLHRVKRAFSQSICNIMQHHTTLCNNVVKRSQHVNITKFHDIHLQRFDWGLTLGLHPHWASLKVWLSTTEIEPTDFGMLAQLLPTEVCNQVGSGRV